MVQYYSYPHGEVPQAARPKSAWELIVEAQAEAARNAEIPGFEPAPSQSVGQAVAQPLTGHCPVPAASYYYCYSVLPHIVNDLVVQRADAS